LPHVVIKGKEKTSMIAKQGWFKRRKYTGWGVTPATWQGWVYIGLLILPIMLLPFFQVSAEFQLVFYGVWFLILILGFIDMAASIKKDEREIVHEAIADRNSLWAMLAILTSGIAYQAARGAINQTSEIDPVILIALIASVVTKAATNIYLDRKD
jgi:UDP-N-acetylmuramyl pentapeptide phosphotransferase/UDP-N-acetylglucosamine-1-phosphate transferase